MEWDGWSVVIGVAVAAVSAWLLLLLMLWWRRPETLTAKEAVRLLPDLLTLLRRLATDPTLPGGVRIRLGLLLAYLAFPVDLVPDFIPVIGYADDAIVVLLTLRAVIRRAGVPALEAHWPGSKEGLSTLLLLADVRNPSEQPPAD